MPSLRIGRAGRWALMAMPRRVLVREVVAAKDELAELRDARCVMQREINWLRAEVLDWEARARAADRELAQAEAELRVAGPWWPISSIYGQGLKGGPRAGE